MKQYSLKKPVRIVSGHDVKSDNDRRLPSSFTVEDFLVVLGADGRLDIIGQRGYRFPMQIEVHAHPVNTWSVPLFPI